MSGDRTQFDAHRLSSEEITVLLDVWRAAGPSEASPLDAIAAFESILAARAKASPEPDSGATCDYPTCGHPVEPSQYCYTGWRHVEPYHGPSHAAFCFEHPAKCQQCQDRQADPAPVGETREQWARIDALREAAHEVQREGRWCREMAERGEPQDAVERLIVLSKTLTDLSDRIAAKP